MLHHLRVRALERAQLVVPAHKSAPQPSDAAWPHQRERADEWGALHPSGLALCLDRPCCIEFEGASRRGDRAGADEDLSGRCTLLQSGTNVDGVACDERAALPRPTDDDVAGVDADAQRESAAEDIAQPSLHAERGMQGPLGVVLERRRRTEDRHHGVAGELLDGAAGGLDLFGHRLVEAVEKRALRGLFEN